MGLIKAAFGAAGGVAADQWKEFFICEALPNDVLVRKGKKKTTGRSSNYKGDENIITTGSGIVVADGQCMIIVDQGKVAEICAEPGEYTYDASTEPSVFSGSFGESLKATFKNIGKRFTYGGEAPKDQRVYYFNTKEILDNKFGTANPIIFEVVNKRLGMSRTVQVRCNGVYSYKISDPILFYTEVCGNVSYEYTREEIDSQLKTEFISALQPAFAKLSELELKPSQIPAKTTELKDALNSALKVEWTDRRGLSVHSIAINPITLTEEDMKKINQMEDAATMGVNPFMMAGRMADAQASAMEAAANNPNGAVNGFMGMGMIGNMGGGNSAQNFYNMGVQQMAQQNTPIADSWKCVCGATETGKFCSQCGAPKPQNVVGWKCSCGAVNKGKFCPECGSKKPESAPLYRCDKCGWEPADPKNPPKFCPECGDIFDENDVK